MKFIDLYAGIGGFRYALEDLGHKCVFSAEKDKYAISTYFKNFPSHNPSFDMDVLQTMTDKEIDSIIPDHDILTGGFPCQPFSMGGKKLGFADIRGTQFFNIVRILEVKKPRFIFLENVSNIVTHDEGKTYVAIRENLSKIGYKIHENPIVISPHEIGIPQRRYRAFFIAELNKGELTMPLIPKRKNIEAAKFLESNGEKELLLDKYYQDVIKAWEEFAKNTSHVNGKKIPDIWLDEMLSLEKGKTGDPIWKIKYFKDMNEFYLRNKDFIDKWVIKHEPLSWGRRERKFEWRAGKIEPDFKNMILMFRTSGLRVMPMVIFPTLVAMAQTPVVYDKTKNAFRKLSVKEVSKLQSFPENFIPNQNENKAMKQFGNSVNVEVIKMIAKSFIHKK